MNEQQSTSDAVRTPSPRAVVPSESWSRFYKLRIDVCRRFAEWWKIPICKRHWVVLAEELRDGQKVLDVGGIEPSRARFESLFPNVEYRSMNIDRSEKHDYYSLDDVDETFDLVMLMEVIEHLSTEQGADMLKRIHELVRPGGLLIVSTPNMFHPNRFWDSDHLTPYRFDELGAMVMGCGFGIRAIYRVYNAPFFQRLFRIYVASYVHRYFCVDFAESILLVGEKTAEESTPA